MEGVAMRNRTFARSLWQYFFHRFDHFLLHYITSLYSRPTAFDVYLWLICQICNFFF